MKQAVLSLSGGMDSSTVLLHLLAEGYQVTAVSWGKTIEKFVPWMKGFPVDPRDSIFLAKPIDYLCFTDRRNKKKSAVHFIEVKSGDANLSHDQEGIKEAIKKNRVFWHEVIVDGYLDNGKNVITKTQRNKKKPRRK